ncbi:MAG: SoxR reducing system RseC family protein [Aureibaculum sp.]
MKHSGVITKISKSAITVSLEGNINCESCNAKAACGISESNSKEIEIKSPLSERAGTFHSFKLNEGVDVVMQTELGLKAVFWAYIFPFILMIVVLIVSSNLFQEWLAGLLSLIVLIPYYFLLYVLKNSFRKAFKISILKNNQE